MHNLRFWCVETEHERITAWCVNQARALLKITTASSKNIFLGPAENFSTPPATELAFASIV